MNCELRIANCELRANNTGNRVRENEIRNPQFEFRKLLRSLRFFLRADLFRDDCEITRHGL